jgi:EmrB/QacA subfamily drug resistance transporter
VDPLFWRVSAVVLLGPLMSQLDSTVVNVALSAIRQDLHASIGGVQWVVGGYLLALALVLPLNGWLVDHVGAKRMYIACFAGFTAASFACGAARSIEALVVARIVQGIAGGLLTPMAQMMTARIAGRHLSRVIGFTAMPVLLAPLVGPTVAGAILKWAGWPRLFYINIPIGIVAIALAILLLPRDDLVKHRRPFDLAGFLLVSPALAILLYGLDHALVRIGVYAIGAGLLLLAVFAGHALRKKDLALVDVRLFEHPVFRIAATTQFLQNGSTFGAQMLLPLFLISGHGYSASDAGWLLALQGIAMLCVYPFTGRLIDRFGCRPVSTSGALLVTLSTVPVVWMTDHAFSPIVMAVALFLRGLGHSCIGVPTVSAVYAYIPREKTPLATTASNIVQRFGGPTATTLLGVILSWTVARGGGLSPQAFTAPFLGLLAAQALTLAAASRLPMRLHHDTAEAQS